MCDRKICILNEYNWFGMNGGDGKCLYKKKAHGACCVLNDKMINVDEIYF